jgi:Family of unknown function (DUF5317)
MLLLAALALGLAIGIVTGGKLGNTANLRFRWPWFVLAALVIREALILSPLSRIEGMQYVYAAVLAALIAWTVWHIDRIRGVWIVAMGALLNLVVVLVNGARMPVAHAFAGSLVQSGHAGQYVIMSSSTNLNWLADWIGVRGVAYSPGDVVVAIGIAIVAFFATRQSPAPTTKLDATSGRIGSYPP